ncbi:MAG: alpha/beta hydrolase [Hyphomicrobiaceae bacterium]
MGGPGSASAEAQAFIAANPPDMTSVPEAATIDTFRKDISAEFRPRAERMLERFSVQHRNVVIADVPCIEVTPTRNEPVGTVLYCYGGGFVCGSAFEDLIISVPLADFANARIIAPEYRLAPEHPWPAAIDDGFAVYRQLQANAEPGTLAIAGESAGGNLALSVLLRADRESLPLPVAAALLSPWCDLRHGGDSLSANDSRDPTLTRAWVDAAAQFYAGDNDLANPDISPLYGAFNSAFPPVMISTGTRDLLMSQCVRLARVLRNSGITADLRVWDDLWHVFEFYDEIPEAEESLREIAGFLKMHICESSAA